MKNKDVRKNEEELELSKLVSHPRHGDVYGEEDVTDLAADLKLHGLQRPVDVVWDSRSGKYRIIDGHRRVAAARLLEWKTIRVRILPSFKSDDDELTAMLLANQYREKTFEQKVREGLMWYDLESADAVDRQKRGKKAAADEKAGSTRDIIARRVGIGSGKTFDKGKHTVNLIDDLREQSLPLAARGLQKELNQSIQSAHRVVERYRDEATKARTIELLEMVGGDVAENFRDAEEMKVKEEFRSIPKGLPADGQRYKLYCGDIATVMDNEKKLKDILLTAREWHIITDIPYGSKPMPESDGKSDTVLDAARKLAAFAADRLPVGCSCLVMVGQHWLPQVLAIFGEHEELSYYWTYAVMCEGESPCVRKRFVIPQWKPVLHFVRGPVADARGCLIKHKIFCDLIKSSPLDAGERVHPWQQPETPFRFLIEHLVKPGTYVVDPMMGTGTTGVAAMKAQRWFIGVDSEPLMFGNAQKRLSATEMELSQAHLLPVFHANQEHSTKLADSLPTSAVPNAVAYFCGNAHENFEVLMPGNRDAA